MPFSALFDACVLVDAATRDILLELAYGGMFRAQWSAQIEGEVRKTLLAKFQVDENATQTLFDAMRSAIPDWEVANYDNLIESLTLPDPNDRHVLAAAIRARSDVIVTWNKKDFPNDGDLRTYNIESQDPDEFISNVYDLYPEETSQACRRIQERLRNPPFTWDEYLEHLRGRGLHTVATNLGMHKQGPVLPNLFIVKVEPSFGGT